MFIIWGTKRVERLQGAVADFCPICREIRPFDLVRIGMASHIYYLSFGEGKLAGHEIRCHTCGVRLATNPARYVTAEKDPRVDLDVLIRNTFPNLRAVCAERLATEDQVRRSPSAVPADERVRLLLEPFVLLNPLVEQRFANSTEMDRQSGSGCLATILVGGGVFFSSMAYRGSTQDKMLIAAVVLVGIGTIYTFVQMHLGPRRFYQARVLPSLVKSLKPLNPGRDEIMSCVERCKTLGLKIGKVAKFDELWMRLERAVAGFDN